jgi:glycosyltransferase involved in cell wall biosynthesis
MAEEESSGRAVQDAPVDDAVALANAIRRLYKSPRRILQYGRAARQRGEAELTWDHFRERLARAYDLVLRQRSPP